MMTEDSDELTNAMKEELRAIADGKYDWKDIKGKTMEEVLVALKKKVGNEENK